MKTSAQPFLWLVLGVTAATVAMGAADTDIVTLGEAGWREQATTLSVMSGDALTLSVLVPTSTNPADVYIEFWQVARGVLIPLKEELSLAAVIEPGSPNSQGVTRLRLRFPEVKRKTQVLVKFVEKGEPHASVGRAQVWVYPPIEWAPLARKFNEGEPRLVVFGADAGLREFFEAKKISFLEAGAEPPQKIDAGTLMIGALSATEWRERKSGIEHRDGRLLVFLTDAPGVPGVYTMVAGAGTITQVTLPVLETLGRDARTTDLFFQIIEQHVHSSPAALP